MKTKIVYVLVSQEIDYYYEMLLLSLYSLRLHHPKGDAVVEVVMDEETHQRLVDKKAEMLNDVTPIVVPIPPEYTIMQRSRYLKTQLRQLVKGDFLYLDTDTLVCNSLIDIDKVDANIAMVADFNQELPLTDPYSIKKTCDAGFGDLKGQPYFNSGVIFTKDDSITYKFYMEWHHLWQQSCLRGIVYDQPALCQANCFFNKMIIELPGIWNCQLQVYNSHQYLEAHIYHYYANHINFSRLLFLDQIKKDNKVNIDVAQIAQNPYTTGYTVFSITDRRLSRFMYSNILFIFDTIPLLFNTFLLLSRIFTRSIQSFSRMKKRVAEIFQLPKCFPYIFFIII